MLKYGKKAPKKAGIVPHDVEYVLTNVPLGKHHTGKCADRKGVRIATDLLCEWIQQAKTVDEVKQLLVDNKQFLVVASRDQQKRIQANATKREAFVAPPAATKRAVEVAPPTLEELNTAFRDLYDTVGEAQCTAILKSLKVRVLKEVPEAKYADCMAAIRSAKAAKRANGESPAPAPT